MYKVIQRFKDLQDEKHVYEAGDIYPREGLRAKKARIAELASNKNKRGTPLIEEVVEDGKFNGSLPGTEKLV